MNGKAHKYMLGEKLGSYEIIEEIGRGGMAMVYRAYQPNMDRDVAVKIISKSISDSDEAVMRFQREARLIARLEHIHILPVYDFDGTHNPPYIVMRYLEGGTLKDVMKQGQLPLSEVVYLMRQVCSAVDYAHRQGIIHRDIKPSNIMIDREGNTFVTDFGIARMAGDALHSGRDENQPITQTGATVGTPDYMAPEQGMGYEDIDHRADVYSLGVMLYEMLTGEKPYTASSPMQVVLKHLQDPIPNIGIIKPDLPDLVELLIYRALAKERDDRFQSVAEFADELSLALGVTIASTPTQLRNAAEQSQMMLLQNRDNKQLEQTMAGFARSRSKTGTESQGTPTEQNKVITALQANLAEYAEIVDEIVGIEAARRAVNAYWNAVETIVKDAGGQIFSHNENDILIVWGAEATSEDDAIQAVQTALTMQEKLRELGAAFLEGEADDEPLPLNIGVNTGIALLTPNDETGDYTATGSTIRLVSRLADNALGTILIGQDTFRAVQGFFNMEEDVAIRVRGRKETIPTFRVTDIKPRSFRVDIRGVQGVETQMIGREAELSRLQSALEEAFEEEETQVVTILGEAGLGKSRLLQEFEIWSDLHPETFRIFQGRATGAMTSRPYSLLRDMISFRFEIRDSDPPEVVYQKMEAGIKDLTGKDNPEMAHLIGHLIGFDLSDSPHIKGILSDPKQLSNRAKQLFKRLFAQIGEIEPMVMQLEDIHHADEASLTLLNELVEENDEIPLMMLCLARPTLMEKFPTWGAGQIFHSIIELQPLERRASRALVKEILQKVDDVPKSLRDLIVDHAEGNPYFMEELVKILIEDRVIITDDPDKWYIEESRLDNLRVPPTLVGLMQTRVDTLLYPEKLTLQRASTLGRIFYDSMLVTIDDQDETHIQDLPKILETLVEREFIYERGTTSFDGHTEYIFAKAMMRDAIYDTLLRRQKQVYHTALADWLVNVSGERIEEYYPLIAEHYELGEDNENAAKYLILAGDQADSRQILNEAYHNYSKALDLLANTNDHIRTNLLLKLAATELTMGQTKEARAHLDEANRFAEKSGDIEARASIANQLHFLIAREGKWAQAKNHLQDALSLARQTDNRALLADILYSFAGHLNDRNDFEQSLIYAEEALEVSRSIGDHKTELGTLNVLGLIWMSKGDLDKASEYLQACVTLAEAVGNRLLLAFGVGNLSNILMEQGKMEEALPKIKQAVDIVMELGNIHNVVAGSLNMAEIYGVLGDLDHARQYLQQALAYAKKLDALPFWISCVSAIGFHKILEGEIESGLILLGAVKVHPAAKGDTTQDMERQLKDLADKLADYDVDAMMGKGKDLDMDKVIADLLEEFEIA